MRQTLKRIALIISVAFGIGALAATAADARPWGHHGGWEHHGGGGFGPGFVGGLPLGAFAAGPYYYGGPRYYGGGPYYAAAGWGGDCYTQRRVRYTPWGPRIRFVRVCY